MQDSTPPPDRTPSPDELETYRRLVDLQSQIVELARRNSESERLCRVLRERLDRQTARGRRRTPRRIFTRLLERIRKVQPLQKRLPKESRRLDDSSGRPGPGVSLDPTRFESI